MEQKEEEKARERLATIRYELDKIRERTKVIEAKHTMRIWLSKTYDSIDYNSRGRVKEAELTLCLAKDKEYQSLIEKQRKLEAEEAVIYIEDDEEYRI